jgi:hypothetical protein
MTEGGSNVEHGAIQDKTFSLFQTISQQLGLLISTREKMLETQKQILQSVGSRSEEGVPPDTLSLLALPLSLRKTVMALYKLQKATADDIATETTRLRGMESAWANQLVRMGYLKKVREGRRVYFYIESPPEIKK